MKIKEEELKLIQEQQKKLNELVHNIGLLESQKHGMLHEIAGVNKEIEDYKEILEAEYGAINIDLENGTYTKIEKMSKVIRKISIGSDYKNDAMHYSTGQEVYGGHTISDILFEDKDQSYNIFITKNNEVLPWKKFNANMSISVEYDLKY